MTNKYSFTITWSEEDKEYVATCPSFPGLSAYGATEEDALREGKIALGLFIESCRENNIPLPEPEIAGDYSGQFRLRIPKSLHAQLARMAAADEVSLNQFVLQALAERTGGQKMHEQAIKELKRTISELVVQGNFTNQSLNWPEPNVREVEITETVTTKIMSAKTAFNKPERGN